MGSILESYDVIARIILQALVNSFWPGLMLLLLAWFALRLINRTSATTRHAIWVVCLCALASLPFLPAPGTAVRTARSTLPPPLERIAANLYRPTTTLAPVLPGRDDLASRRERTPTVNGVSEPARLPSSSPSVAFAEPSISSPVAGVQSVNPEAAAVEQPGVISSAIGGLFSGRLPGALVAVWLLVALFLSARIAWSYLFLFRIRQRLGLVPAHHREQGRRLAEVFGIRRHVRLFTSPLVGAPMTIGWLRPLVILPPDLLRNLGEDELNSILAHELAHIKRWDYVTNLVQRLAQAVLFFHPAVWVIGRQLSLERELACDDWAIKLTGEPRRYAKCLTRLVETMSDARTFAAATGIIFGKHVISRRIEMILNRERNATTSVSKAALSSAIGSAALAVTLAVLISPAIAIPLAPAPQLAKRAQAPKVATPVAASEQTPAVAAAPAVTHRLEAAGDLTATVDSDATLLPTNTDEPVFELLETMPTTTVEPASYLPQLAPLAQNVTYRRGTTGVADWVAPVVARDFFAQTPATPAAPAQPAKPPRIRSVGGIAFADDRDAQPTIPEAELLTILTDVVKRDSDPNVRSEALRGIYRFRSDAAVNALLSLYDSIPDAKTRGEILSYIMRGEGDNSKAIAKLLSIAKTEKDETLRSRALSQLAKVKGDEGANHLIQIYDTLQDSKEKQTVIRYLGYNRSRKAADKLVQIAKNDADPAVRQSAIRSLYAIDNRLYLEMRDKIAPPAKISGAFQLDELDRWRSELERGAMVIDREALEKQMEEARRQVEEMKDRFHFLPELKFTPEVKVIPEVKIAPKIK